MTKTTNLFGLTKKQKKFVQAKLDGANNTEAAREAYDTRHPALMGYRVSRLPKVREYLEKLQETVEGEIPVQKMMELYNQLLAAKDADGNYEWETIRKTLDQIHKLMDHYPGTKHRVEQVSMSIPEKMVKELYEGGSERSPDADN